MQLIGETQSNALNTTHDQTRKFTLNIIRLGHYFEKSLTNLWVHPHTDLGTSLRPKPHKLPPKFKYASKSFIFFHLSFCTWFLIFFFPWQNSRLALGTCAHLLLNYRCEVHSLLNCCKEAHWSRHNHLGCSRSGMWRDIVL